jgi:hypothetical protein
MTPDLNEIAGNLADYAGGLIDIALRQKSAASMGKVCNDISRHYRALGICGLLIHADRNLFFHGLIQSALTRKYYLGRCSREGISGQPEMRSSFVDPFLDAVAANQLKLAGQVASLAAQEWLEGHEYEDDFSYARVLHGLSDPAVRRGPGPQKMLQRYEKALEDGKDPRFEICKALLGGSGNDFADSFERLLDDHERRTSKIGEPRYDSIMAQEYTFEPNRRILVEGLALLRIAMELGIATEKEYRFCPAMARRFDYRAFQPESFPNLTLDD